MLQIFQAGCPNLFPAISAQSTVEIRAIPETEKIMTKIAGDGAPCIILPPGADDELSYATGSLFKAINLPHTGTLQITEYQLAGGNLQNILDPPTE